MNLKTLVSVCLPTYNAEQYIMGSLQSIINQQTNFKYEIIISDDGSTDKTIDNIQLLLKESNFDNFKILQSKQNRGINSNLKRAFLNCSGKYIAILDADDIWTDSQKLQRQYDILNDNAQLDYTYTNYIYSNAKEEIGKMGLDEHFRHPTLNHFEQQLLAPYICICTIFFKNSILNIKLIDEFITNDFISQDYPLLLEFAKNYKGIYEDKITTKVILKSNSLSRPDSIEKRLVYFQNCHKIGTFFIEKYGTEQEVQIQRDFYFHLKMVLLLWKTKDYKRIKKYAQQLAFKNFIRYQPKSIYIFLASKNKLLYKLFKPWVLRKRPPGE